ncbi:MAG: site-specific DNA-methyltransferase [Candidatus Omnitrophica bacterium]|nr:site-specific DNA-methyltransferase [Candidatus Omnitrophota bacterium]
MEKQWQFDLGFIEDKKDKVQIIEPPIQRDFSKKISVVFRDAIPEIPSTTYGTFGIYKYPAKFIPQVIAYILKKYGKPGMKVFDPFAGYGTVGIVSRIYGYHYELWELNPIINLIHATAVLNKKRIDVYKLISELKCSKKEFFPEWSNLKYWFPEEFLSLLCKSWGFAHHLDNERKYFLLIPLLKVTR